jgi:hypothetical protein
MDPAYNEMNPTYNEMDPTNEMIGSRWSGVQRDESGQERVDRKGADLGSILWIRSIITNLNFTLHT